MPKVNIQKTFSKAIGVTKQEQKILELQQEIDKLRLKQSPELEKQIEELRDQLLRNVGEKQVAVELIKPNPYQPRKTITEESIESIARSLDSEGQDCPVIIIPEGDSYILWDGERRWRGAKLLGWKYLRAVQSPMPDNLHRKALITFLQHEDLNLLDRAEAIINEIAFATSHPIEFIPSAIRAIVRRLERNEEIAKVKELVNLSQSEQKVGIEVLDLNDEQKDILAVVVDLQLNPASFAANDLQVLSLFDDLKLAIRKSGLKGSHAQALQKLNAANLSVSDKKAKAIRSKATQEVIKKGLALSKTKALVQELIAKHNAQSQDLKVQRKVKSIMRSIEQLDFQELDIEQLEELKDLFTEKLNYLEDQL